MFINDSRGRLRQHCGLAVTFISVFVYSNYYRRKDSYIIITSGNLKVLSPFKQHLVSAIDDTQENCSHATQNSVHIIKTTRKIQSETKHRVMMLSSSIKLKQKQKCRAYIKFIAA